MKPLEIERFLAHNVFIFIYGEWQNKVKTLKQKP